jgi:phospholipase/carboxylesterase
MTLQSDLLIQRSGAMAERQLLLLFHGVGSSAEDLRPLGEALAAHRPHACVVSVRSPDPSDLGRGWQWFSVQGVTEANRPHRVAAAMPRFVEAVRVWQRESGAAPSATTLIGFSQGSIMALESTQQSELIAGRVIALAGRFAQAPRVASPQVLLHLLHGEADRVMPPALATDALAQWHALGGKATLDLFPGLGHGIEGDHNVTLPIGMVGLARDALRHDPPTPAELERAIDLVEDALMLSRLAHGARGDLVTADPVLLALPGLDGQGASLTREGVESLFQSLASRALGMPASADESLHGPEVAAAIIILRECMHHLGFDRIRTTGT